MNIKTGKLEAYWFPPLDVAPYSKDVGKVITRLGLKKGVTKPELVEALKVGTTLLRKPLDCDHNICCGFRNSENRT